MTAKKRGGQPGNRNAFKTGLHTAEMRSLRKQARLRMQKLKAAMEAARYKTLPPQKQEGRRAEGAAGEAAI
ncbi:MAG TPA: hypothetical protein VHD95_12425 [Rhizomicrobium sp.]|jgi:hypothetical protein|nr:hypothetical protein [Rhizomicrobium sp.]